MKMTWRLTGLGAALLLPVLIAAACGVGSGGPKARPYQNDGYMGMTNTNPNLQSGPSYHTYAMDTNMMRNAVTPITGIRKVRITTNGANATVTLTVPKDTPDAEKERIYAEAMQRLHAEVPRYDFKVKLVPGR